MSWMKFDVRFNDGCVGDTYADLDFASAAARSPWRQPRHTSSRGTSASALKKVIHAKTAREVPATGKEFYDYECTYLDAFCDGGQMHIFFAPGWKMVVHLVVNLADLLTIPTQSQSQAGSRKQTFFRIIQKDGDCLDSRLGSDPCAI